MKCTHCGRELINYRRSNPIPDASDNESEKCYIMASCCNNVMIATFKDGEMTDVQPTPETDTPETRAMMQQAAELFRVSGSMFYTQKVSSTSHAEPIYHEQPAEKESAHHSCSNCTCHQDEPKTYHKECCNQESKKPNVFKRLIQKLLKLFKK